jgi:L-ascorbate metabolism protein UlaG (beta-lactamase superfamily)
MIETATDPGMIWNAGALGAAAGADEHSAVRVRWLGTAGFEIAHGGTVVLVDPYVTRASLARCVVGPLRPDRAAVARYASRADAIVAGHTHFDHVLDVPEIAARTGAKVFGSRSAVNLCRAAGLPETQLSDVERAAGSEPVVAEVGPFRLRFVPSAHSAFVLGRVPFPGDIADCDEVPLRTERYRCGAVFDIEITVAGRTLYHVGSANLIESSVRSHDVDLLLLCVAGWTSTRAYPERIVRALSPSAILLSHWDSFFSPLDRAAKELPRMQVGRLVDRLSAASRDVKIGSLPLLGDVFL